MEGGGASAGAGASLGLSVAATPAELGQLFPSKQAARLAVETKLAKDRRAIKKARAPAAASSTSSARPARHGLSGAASRKQRSVR